MTLTLKYEYYKLTPAGVVAKALALVGRDAKAGGGQRGRG
jgi:hypothetical protein